MAQFGAAQAMTETATPGTLGVGTTSLRQTINEISALSLGTSLKVIAAIARVALALVAVAGVFASVRCWRRRDGCTPLRSYRAAFRIPQS